mgnify:CR=1 FL=1
MSYKIVNNDFLRLVLWIDFICGFSTGICGLLYPDFWSKFLGLNHSFLFWICLISLSYSVLAFSLAIVKKTNVMGLLLLIRTNWLWTLISLIFLFFHLIGATLIGKIFLIGQLFIAALLAYIEGKQLIKSI